MPPSAGLITLKRLRIAGDDVPAVATTTARDSSSELTGGTKVNPVA